MEGLQLGPIYPPCTALFILVDVLLLLLLLFGHLGRPEGIANPS